jgi:hypothetical protein
MMRRLAGILVALGAAAPLAAQGVLVAPTAVYIDHVRRSSTITLYNPAAANAQVRNITGGTDHSASTVTGSTM